MPEPLDEFLRAFKKNDVDDILLDTPVVENTLEALKDTGEDLVEGIKKSHNSQPDAPTGLTPTYQESAFIKTGKESTLYNVTNTESDVPEVTKSSKKFGHLSFGVNSFTTYAKVRRDNMSFKLYAGEKFGIGISKKEQESQNFDATYNISSGKTNLSYSYSDGYNNYKVSVFNQESNFGASAYYSNNRGFNASVSTDRNSTSAEIGYKNTLRDGSKLDFGVYATTGDRTSCAFMGVRTRISF